MKFKWKFPFLLQDKKSVKYFAPTLTDEDFNKQVGRYSESIFVPGTNRALTATSVGNLVVWQPNKGIRGAFSYKAAYVVHKSEIKRWFTHLL